MKRESERVGRQESPIGRVRLHVSTTVELFIYLFICFILVIV